MYLTIFEKSMDDEFIPEEILKGDKIHKNSRREVLKTETVSFKKF